MPEPVVTPAVIVPPAPAPSGDAAAPTPAPPVEGAAVPPEAPVSEQSPAAKSRALTRELIARKKLDAERAALVKERQDIHVLRAEATRLKDIEARSKAAEDEAKKDPLAWLEKNGKSYEDITKAMIAKHGANSPEAQIAKIQSERAAEKAAAAEAAQQADLKQKQAEGKAKLDAYIGGIHEFATKGEYKVLKSFEPEYAKQLIFDVADEMYRRNGGVTPEPKAVCDAIEKHLIAEAKKVTDLLTPKEEAAAAEGETVKDPQIPKEVQQMIDKEKAKRKPSTLTNKTSASPMAKSEVQAGKKMTKSEFFKALRAGEIQFDKG